LRALVVAVATLAAGFKVYLLLRPQYVPPVPSPPPAAPPSIRSLRTARLIHNGDWNADPKALSRLSAVWRSLFYLPHDEIPMAPSNPNLVNVVVYSILP
jgi:hypothetical protein